MGQYQNNNLKHNLEKAKEMLEEGVPAQEIARTFQSRGIHIDGGAIVGAVAALDAFQHKPLTHKVAKKTIADSNASREQVKQLNGFVINEDGDCLVQIFI